jgi:hypothetical protein
MQNIFISLLTILAISASSQAAFKSDFYLGGSTGGQLVYTKTAVKYTHNNGGVPAGLFLGWKSSKGFYTGVEAYYIGMGYLDGQSPATQTDASFAHTIAGLKLGFEGGKWGVWAAYDPMSTKTIYHTPAQTNYADAFNGSSMGLGFTYMMGGKLGLEVGYYSHTYTTFDNGALKNQNITGASTYNSVTDSDAMITLKYALSGGK